MLDSRVDYNYAVTLSGEILPGENPQDQVDNDDTGARKQEQA